MTMRKSKTGLLRYFSLFVRWLSLSLASYAFVASNVFLPGRMAHADDFFLRHGGQIRGTKVGASSKDEAVQESKSSNKARTIQIETKVGIRVEIPSDDVSSRVPAPASLDEYESVAPHYGATVKEQLDIANWCREKRLKEQRRLHLTNVLAIDPYDAQARRALGYWRKNGKWVEPAEWFRSNGYVRFEGKWRLTHEVDNIQLQRQRSGEIRQWNKQIARWKKGLLTEDRVKCEESLRSIRDPLAVLGLRAAYKSDSDIERRIFFLECVAQISPEVSTGVLIEALLSDPHEDVVKEAAKQIARAPAGLSVKPLIKELQSNDTTRLNRAAYALGEIGDVSAISPLIDALTSIKKTVVRPPGSNAISFAPDGNTVAGPQPFEYQTVVTNSEALKALVKLTSTNLYYNATAWRAWYNLNKNSLAARAHVKDVREKPRATPN